MHGPLDCCWSDCWVLGLEWAAGGSRQLTQAKLRLVPAPGRESSLPGHSPRWDRELDGCPSSSTRGRRAALPLESLGAHQRHSPDLQ